MSVPSFMELAPMVMMIVEILKRFIPDKKRTWANPLLAIVSGMGLAYGMEGTQGLSDIAMQGFGAAAAAIGAYKIPKMVGAGLNIQ